MSRSRLTPWLLATLVPLGARGALATAAPSTAVPATAAPAAAGRVKPLPVASDAQAGLNSALKLSFEKYRLKNGLEVLLHYDANVANVAINLWYHAGPVNEPSGRSGFAHLFEHLMFEGSKYAGRKFDGLLESAGGTNMNGTTSWDRTNYFETVPSEYLELALWLEADRMGFMIDGVNQERLDIQREVVKNERRESLENQPEGPTYLATMDALFPVGHPYHGAIIGSMADLSSATLKDVREFYDAYYAPANATLAIAGRFEPDATKAWIEKYYGSLKPRAVVNSQPPPEAPALKAQHLEVSEPVELFRLSWAFRVPPAYSESDAALDLAARILAEGKASRLERALVKTGLANEVSVNLDSNRLASTFLMQARLARNVKVATIQRVFAEEIARLSKDGPTPAELRRALKTYKVSLASDLQSLNGSSGETGRAGLLQRLNYYLGDPGALPRVLAAYDAVDAAQVKRALSRYVTAEHCIEVVTVPRNSTGSTPAAPTPAPTPAATPSAAAATSATPSAAIAAPSAGAL